MAIKRWLYQNIKTEKQTVSVRVDENNQIIDPVDSLPAKPDTPNILEEIEQWVLKDPEYKLRQTHLDNHPANYLSTVNSEKVTAQKHPGKL